MIQNAAPAWLARLFPHTGAPERRGNRLSRKDAQEFDARGETAGYVVCTLVYPEIDGKETLAEARIYLPPILRKEPNRRVPLIHNAGYEIDTPSVTHLLQKGNAVSTTHAHPLNPLGRGDNLDRAILHAARALPFVDPRRVAIQGGSAGGWMTLMLAAETFPIVYAMPDVPPIHWGYNAGFIDDNKARAQGEKEGDPPRLPVTLAVSAITDQARQTFGMPWDSDTFLATSPLANLDTITAPTLAVFSTADMLVPVDQAGERFVRPFDRSAFPDGFFTAMSPRYPGVKGKRTLIDALPPSAVEVFVVPVPGNPIRLLLDTLPTVPGTPIKLPFSRRRPWSLVVIDEGPPEPKVGHMKYHLAIDHEPFRRWVEEQGILPEQCTRAKLQRLMRRYRGEPWLPYRVRPGNAGEPIPATILDWPEAERADVLTGLRAFAESDPCAERLAQVYARLPERDRVFGKTLGDGTPAGVRAALAAVSAT